METRYQVQESVITTDDIVKKKTDHLTLIPFLHEHYTQ